MRFENEWPGDATAAPICGAYDREDAFIESLGGRSWNWVDRRSDQGDAEPTALVLKDWRDQVTKPPPVCSAPNSKRQLRRAGANTDTGPTNFAGWRAWVTSIASIVAKLWSRILREREIRRISAGWERVDDRTLKDIGISRYEIEYGRDARHGS